MIYGNKILEQESERYLEQSKNVEITIGDFLIEEDVQLKTKNKDTFEMNIRSKYQGGRSNTVINHGPAVKVRFDREFIDLYIISIDKGYDCEIDNNKTKKEKSEIKRNKNFKVAKKFIQRNGEDLINAWNAKEEDLIFKQSIENIKEREPQFIYKKSGRND